MYTYCIYTDIYGAIITGWNGCSDLFHLDRWGGAIPQMAELFRSVKCDNLLRSIGVICCERFFFCFLGKDLICKDLHGFDFRNINLSMYRKASTLL